MDFFYLQYDGYSAQVIIVVLAIKIVYTTLIDERFVSI